MPRDGPRRRSRSTPTATATARHVREADQARAHRAERGGAELPAHRRDRRRRAPVRRRRRASRATASSPRTPAFARACRDAGLTFIGPSPEAIALMGSKTAARERGDPRRRAGRARHRAAARRRAPRRGDRARRPSAIGYPLVVKAVAGGGGKGMRVVDGAGGPARGDPHGAVRGRLRVRRHRRLPRAADRAAAPHRDSAARRSPRHGRAVRRARVLDPAAPPEGGRGVAVDRGDAGAARADGGGRGRRGARRSATPTPARSSSCSTRTARSTSSR